MALVQRYEYQISSQSFDERIKNLSGSLNSITGSSISTGSFVTTSSFNAFTSSYNTGSFTGSFTGSLLGTASYAATSSVAISASYAPVFPYTGSALITGSLGVTGSVSLRSGSNLIVSNGLISASYGTNNLSVGGTPGWTSGLRNTAFGISNQGSVTTQTDNTSVGYLSLLGGTQNTAVGAYATSLNTGTGNTAIGYYALGNQTSTTSYNVAVGYRSMYNASGSGNLYNVGIGYQALNNTRGADNIAIGQNAGLTNTAGGGNISLGYYAGAYSTTGNANISIGYYSGNHIVEGSNNVILGQEAGGNNPGIGITMGTGNVGIGYQSLYAISSSVGAFPVNVAIGFQAGRGLTTGAGNIAIGNRAGYGIGKGGGNIYIGGDAGGTTTSTLTISSNIGIGGSALASNISGSFNTAIGLSALGSAGITSSGANNGGYNTALGYNAGSILKTGIYNVFVGLDAGANNSGNPVGNGSFNVFMGYRAGMIQGNNGDWGDYCVGIGTYAMGYNGGGTPVKPGTGNTALGASTLTLISSSATAQNTAVGYRAGIVLGTGERNTLLGANAGDTLSTGSYNIMIGDNAGDGIVSGSNNTIIGTFTGLTASLNDTLIIGTGTTRRIFVNSVGSGSFTGSLTVTGPLTTNNSFLYTSSAFQTILDTTGFKLTNVASGSQSASIQVSGNGTVGGATYIDFIRVTNTSAGAIDPNKTFRVNSSGTWEVINSAYDTTIFSLTNAGVLNTPGGGTSDRRTKDNINYITESATYTINQLQPAEFEFKNNLGVKRHGFIAQDVLEIKPDLVLGDGDKENGTYGLDYDGILALTVKALQEANTRIDKLEKTIEELKNK